MTKTMMTGGEAVVAALEANGVRTLYGLPGVQLDHLFNALHGATDWLRVVNARHEQGVAYMALGHAQSTGTPGVYACVPGPGFLNTTAALSTAYAVHAPVLALIGQIHSKAIGVGGGELHELPDQTAIVRGLTRWNGIAHSPEDVPGLMRTAFEMLASGIGPVAVELPADVLAAHAMMDAAVKAEARPPALPPEHLVASAAHLLIAARRPLIMAGAGAYGGEGALARIAERLGAPVMMHLQGRGLLESSHPLAIGMGEGRQIWNDADVILAVGTRFHRLPAEWGLSETQKVVRIDTDPARFTIGRPPEIAIAADGAAALEAIAGRLAHLPPRNEAGIAAAAILKAKTEQRIAIELAPQMAYLAALRQALPADAHIVADYTQIGYMAADRHPVARPRQMLTPGYQGTLGWAYATALGAKSANPDKVVVALCGDGGFLFTANEMATAVAHGIAAIGIVFVDGAYGNVQRMQREDHGGKVIASDLVNPEFERFAESFGAKARRAETADGLAEALRWAMDQTGPTLIVAPVPRFPSPWALIEP
ncbi:thiamine pyrophosphate-dependent enzyme [Arsenicitalea aurantiaca]|uniref:thiamine pyrophosphate-dependent enzyme n=1 Tax=Arsenicitalea aurantiaca TaxID=1783274 RepID=UPI0013158048|nr:thiamine pyrophosphate-dependent enzyme [Arsenicitalea aurantiaca]